MGNTLNPIPKICHIAKNMSLLNHEHFSACSIFIPHFFFLSGHSEGCYKPCRHEKSPSKTSEVISPEVLKMRAALFCIFTYLDTKTLLRTAEVCRDWRFVARHPAVWTRVLLENARISSKVPCFFQDSHHGLHGQKYELLDDPGSVRFLNNKCFGFFWFFMSSSCARSLSGVRRPTLWSCRTSNQGREERRRPKRSIWRAHGTYAGVCGIVPCLTWQKQAFVLFLIDFQASGAKMNPCALILKLKKKQKQIYNNANMKNICVALPSTSWFRYRARRCITFNFLFV